MRTRARGLRVPRVKASIAVLVALPIAVASVTVTGRSLSPLAPLGGCYCSSAVPPLTEAVSAAKDEAASDFKCKSGDVAASFVASSHSEQATVRAQGCNQTANYGCSVSCGDWNCSRIVR